MAFCWTAKPCNPWYSTEFDFCTQLDYPALHNEVAYLGTSDNAFTLINNGACVCSGDYPIADFVVMGNCPPSQDYYLIENCVTGVQKIVLTDRVAKIGTIKLSSNPCECWNIIQGEGTQTPPLPYDAIIAYFPSCDLCPTDSVCEDSDRTLASGIFLRLPIATPPDRGFKECCFKLKVLAHKTNREPYFNDFNSFYFQKQIQSDSVQFDLINTTTAAVYSLHNSTYGKWVNFGQVPENINLSYVTVEWQKVLNLLGEGAYQIRMIKTVAGISITQFSNTYHLEEFTFARANDTIRIDSIMSGQIIGNDVDFTGSQYKDSLRINGFFGREKPIYTQDNLIYKDYIERQINMLVDTEFVLQTNDLPECIGTYLQYFLLLGNELLMNDYNNNNYSYNYQQVPVVLGSASDPEYFVKSRRTVLEFTFLKRNKDWKKINP